MKTNRKLYTAVFSILLAACVACGASAANVTINFAQKTIESDSKTLKPVGVRTTKTQLLAIINSELLTAQQFTAKISELPDESYDVYVNSEFAYTKSKSELASGISLETPARSADPAKMRCLNALEPVTQAEFKEISNINTNEARRAAYTLSQAADWIRGALRLEQSYRSADIRLAPHGYSLEQMPFRNRKGKDETNEGIVSACRLLQDARTQMSIVLKDAALKERTVRALTPIEFGAKYTELSNTLKVDFTVVNNCDLDVWGEVKVIAPKGWKIKDKPLPLKGLKPGAKTTRQINLIKLTKDLIPVGEVNVAADFAIKDRDKKAVFKLTAKADECNGPIIYD